MTLCPHRCRRLPWRATRACVPTSVSPQGPTNGARGVTLPDRVRAGIVPDSQAQGLPDDEARQDICPHQGGSSARVRRLNRDDMPVSPAEPVDKVLLNLAQLG